MYFVAANYPFLDHQAPPFRMIIEFCKDAWDWLSRDEHNVVVIHCKAGKGRTGTLVASLLLHLGEAKNATEAIELYGEKRTMDMKVNWNKDKKEVANIFFFFWYRV